MTPVTRVRTTSADATRDLARRVAPLLRAGDVLVLAGPLGAGKTTFVQGLAAGLGIGADVVSPTFVLARHLHGGRLPLVHVDAYRLADGWELDDLDLDTDLSSAVVAIEWGSGLAHRLADSVLTVELTRDDGADERGVSVTGTGPRWAGVDLAVVTRP